MAHTQGIDNLIYLFILVFPSYDAKKMYTDWKQNPILKEYRRPSLKNLEKWTLTTYHDLAEIGIHFKTN